MQNATFNMDTENFGGVVIDFNYLSSSESEYFDFGPQELCFDDNGTTNRFEVEWESVEVSSIDENTAFGEEAITAIIDEAKRRDLFADAVAENDLS